MAEDERSDLLSITKKCSFVSPGLCCGREIFLFPGNSLLAQKIKRTAYNTTRFLLGVVPHIAPLIHFFLLQTLRLNSSNHCPLYVRTLRVLTSVVKHTLTCQLKKKNAQCESCELSFIWGKRKTTAWETAFQIALRNCSGLP